MARMKRKMPRRGAGDRDRFIPLRCRNEWASIGYVIHDYPHGKRFPVCGHKARTGDPDRGLCFECCVNESKAKKDR